MEGHGRDKKIELGREKFEALRKRNIRRGGSMESGLEQQHQTPARNDSSAPASSSSYTTAEEDPNALSSSGSDMGLSTRRESKCTSTESSVEQLHAHVKQLEEQLADKDSALSALAHELDAIRDVSCIDASVGPLTLCVESEYKAHLNEYHQRQQEFSAGIAQRDEMIQKLAESLKQSVEEREAHQKHAAQLTGEVQLLQAQLRSCNQHAEQPQKMLFEVLKEKEEEIQRMSLELANCKTQCAQEVKELVSKLEELQRQVSQSSSGTSRQHELPVYQQNPDTGFRRQLNQIKDDPRVEHGADVCHMEKESMEAEKPEPQLRSQLNAAHMECEQLKLELSTLKIAHEAELSSYKDQMQNVLGRLSSANSSDSCSPQGIKTEGEIIVLKKQVISLKQKLKEESNLAARSIQILQQKLREKAEESSKNKEELCKLQNQLQNYASDMLLCQQTINQYKQELEEMQAKVTDELSLEEANHRAELALLKEQMFEMQQNDAKDVNFTKHELDSVKLEVRKKTEDILSYKQQMEALNQQLQNERQWGVAYKQQIQALNQQLKDEKQFSASYHLQADTLGQQLKEEQQQVSHYKDQSLALIEQLKNEQSYNVSLTSQLTALQESIKTSQKSNECLNEQVSKLEGEVKFLRRLIQENEENIISYRQQVQATNEQLKAVQNLNTSYKSQLEKLDEQLKDQLQLREELVCKIEALSCQLSGEKDIAKLYKLQAEEFNKKLKELQEMHSNELLLYQKQLKELKATHDDEMRDCADENKEEKNQFLKEEHTENVMQGSGTEVAWHASESDEFSEALSRKLVPLSDTDLIRKEKNDFSEESIASPHNQYTVMSEPTKKPSIVSEEVKALLLEKNSLEKRLIENQKQYESQISSLQERVAKLQEQSHISCGAAVDAVQAVVNTCRKDIVSLQSFYKDHITKQESADTVDFRNDICSSSIDEDEDSNSSRSKEAVRDGHKDCVSHHSRMIRLAHTDASSKAQLQASRAAGIEALQKVLDDAERCLQTEDPHDHGRTFALRLTESALLIEKLKLQLEESREESTSLKIKCEEHVAHCTSLENRVKELEFSKNSGQENKTSLECVLNVDCEQHTPETSDCHPTKSSQFILRWVKKCTELEVINSDLLNQVQALETKLKESELGNSLPLRLSSLERSQHEAVEKVCSSSDFVSVLSKERQTLESLIESMDVELAKPLSSEEVQNLLCKCLTLDESSLCHFDGAIRMNIEKLVLGLGEKSKENIYLQTKIKAEKQALVVAHLQLEMQSEELKKMQSKLEEAWHERITVESDLSTAQRKLGVLGMRMERLEACYKSSCRSTTWSQEELCRMVDDFVSELESAKLTTTDVGGCKDSSPLFLEKLESAIKIGHKMLSEKESLLVKLQSDQIDPKVVANTLQSEALNIRRVVTSLEETLQKLYDKSKPALNVHVILLQKQLADMDKLYQEACNTQFSMEAELRELEDKALEQESQLQDQVRRLRRSVNYWRLQAEASQVSCSIHKVRHSVSPEQLDAVFEDIESAHSLTIQQLRDELNRVSSLKESKLRAEYSEQIANLEQKHKEDLEQVINQQNIRKNMNSIEALHRQELKAISAQFEATRLQEIFKVRQELSSLPMPKEHESKTCKKSYALNLMKQQVATEYTSTVMNSALARHTEWQQKIVNFKAQLDSVVDTKISRNTSEHDPDSLLGGLEKLISEVKGIGEQLSEVHSDGLRKLLALLEEEHKQLMEQLHMFRTQTEMAGRIKELHDELTHSKEMYRASLEDMAASHEKELSRLRLLLAEAQTVKGCEPNEATLVAVRQELEEKHKRQMEELRTYFEQKCSDFEKHYSEEVFSQHSRKMSDCSSASESELVSEMYYAGPGSASGVGPIGELQRLSSLSHICDSLGESSFKDLEEPIRPDFEKLFSENREQAEAMRLAVESRYQGELEAQREEYEARVEDLVRNMTENHQTELSLQARRLQDLQDGEEVLTQRLTELEKEVSSLRSELEAAGIHRRCSETEIIKLKTQLSDAQNQIKSLQEIEVQSLEIALQNDTEELINDGIKKAVSELTSDGTMQGFSSQEAALRAVVQKLSATLKKKETESSEQIATLKSKLRQNHDLMSKYEKDISNLKVYYEEEMKTLRKSLEEKNRCEGKALVELKPHEEEHGPCSEMELEKRIRQKVDTENQRRWTELCGQLEEKDAERDRQLSELRNQLQDQQEAQMQEKDAQCELKLAEFRDHQETLLNERKQQLEEEYSEYLEFVKKCADETKQLIELHQRELSELRSEHERELACIRDGCGDGGRRSGEAVQGSTLEDLLRDRGSFKDSLLAEHMLELQKISEELEVNHQAQLEALEASLVRIHKDALNRLQQQASLKEDEMRREQEARVEAVQQECERRFHLQLEEARADIVHALEHHIQALLNDDDVGDKPHELLQLEKKLSSKYLQKQEDLQREHETQLTQLKEKHSSEMQHLRDQLQTPIKTLISAEKLEKLYKERDCLRNVAATLRDVVAELVRYFMSCEDELNNTLMDELIRLEGERDTGVLCGTPTRSISFSAVTPSKDDIHKSAQENKEEMSLVVATPASSTRGSSFRIRRVHFAPDVSSILTFIEDESLLDCVGGNVSVRNVSLNFHEELDRCLARLRCESAALLALSKSTKTLALPASQDELPESAQDELMRLRAQLIEVQESKEQLSSRFVSARRNVRQLEQDNEELQMKLDSMQEEQEVLLAELQSMRQRLDSLDSHQRVEVVTEGYGEGNNSVNGKEYLQSPHASTLEQLQEKARSLLLGVGDSSAVSGIVSPNTSQQLPHVVDELCRDWERLAEEARCKQDDLQQQVEAADKQIRATRAFLDEQASDREQEREEFVREIKRLGDLLRDRDRDHSSQRHMNKEVEDLESQLKDIQSSLLETREKLEQVETERNSAVEKIWMLREIISDLEGQVATKAQEGTAMQEQNEALQRMLEQQGRTHLELAQEMEALQLGSGNTKLAEHISQLEQQLQKHQMQMEQITNPVAVRQMKSQLRELETSLEQRTKELEHAHTTSIAHGSPCLSSPSEDVSIRDTLEVMRAAAGAAAQSTDRPVSPLTLPLEEVARLQEQIQRHSRADDAALKHIRDLDMQLEEVQAERNALSGRLQEQMLQISTLRARLDEQRRKADTKQAQATAELRTQLQDLQSEIDSLRETLDLRERQIKNLESSLQLAHCELKKREMELRRSIEADQNVAATLQRQVAKLTNDKERLQDMLRGQSESQMSLPLLVESMLADKNADIDRLEKQVLQLTHEMELNSEYVATPCTTLEFEYRESEKVRCHVELSPVLELRRSIVTGAAQLGSSGIKEGDESHHLIPHVECSSIERDLGLSALQLSPKPVHPRDLMVSQISEQDTTKEDDNKSGGMDVCNPVAIVDNPDQKERLLELESLIQEKTQQLEDCKKQLIGQEALKSDLQIKSKCLEEYEERAAEMTSLEAELHAVKAELQDTITGIAKDKIFLETQLQEKDAENQRLSDEVRSLQTILANLKSKLQEARLAARSPSSRVSPDDRQALRMVHNELDAARTEISQLQENYSALRSQIESENKHHEVELEETSRALQMSEKELKEQLKDVQAALKEKDDLIKQLQETVTQLDMECCSLKHQLSVPVNEAVNLAVKLDSEKLFATTLKEELSLCKTRVIELEKENCDIKNKLADLEMAVPSEKNMMSLTEVAQQFQEEISNLKRKLEQCHTKESNDNEHAENCVREITILKEENFEVGKELSDMKNKMQVLEVCRKDLKLTLQENARAMVKANEEIDLLKNQLFSLRNAVENIESNQMSVPGLSDADILMLNRLRSKLSSVIKTCAGDGPQHRLSASEVDVCEIEPADSHFTDSESLDDLTGMVQRELDESIHLDHSLLQTLDPIGKGSKRCAVAVSPSKHSAKSQPAVSEGNINLTAQQEETWPQLDRTEQIHPWDLDLNKERERVGILEQDLLKERERVRILERDLNKEKAHVQLLQNQLEAEYVRYNALQQQDCDLLETMRVNLEKALNAEGNLRLQLEQVKLQAPTLTPILQSKPKDVPNVILSQAAQNSNVVELSNKLGDVAAELKKEKSERVMLEKQLRRLHEAEVQRSRRRAANEEQHRRKIDQLEAQQNEAEQEMSVLRQQLATMSQELKVARGELANERESHIRGHGQFLQKLKNMSKFLEEHIQENAQLAKQMESFTEENRQLRARVAQLEQQLADRHTGDTWIAASGRFATDRAQWERERSALHLALTEANQKHIQCPKSELEDRVNCLFGRYQRSESYRKSLVWQKRYLLVLLDGYREASDLTSNHISHLRKKPRLHQNPRERFRSYVFVVIGIQRMRLMVNRWLRGKRIGCSVVLNHAYSQFALSSKASYPGASVQTRPQFDSIEELRAGLSQSPPTLERPRQPHPLQANSSQFFKMNSHNTTTTIRPESLSNFEMKQQHFDAVLAHPPK